MGKVQNFLPDGIYERLDKRFHFDTTNAEFLSPWYGEKTGDFVRRAYRRAKKTGEPIVLVIPENMRTKYFQECIEGKAEVIHNDVLDIGCPTMTVIYNGSCTENKGRLMYVRWGVYRASTVCAVRGSAQSAAGRLPRISGGGRSEEGSFRHGFEREKVKDGFY